LETRLLIRGEQVAGEGAGIAIENPATEETLTELHGASPEQVDAAIAGAREAARGWAATPAVERAEETELLREETFGPVAPIVPVSSLDEAIELANSTPFGLGANVYTRDLETAVRCLREIRAGTVWINDPLTDNDAGPFGGFKQSGMGRELGQEGLEAFQETKHVHIETKIAPKEWWYPYAPGV
jgi:acyl-CoA reductase-like NAD-dependent aldehyde dehydrogenase